MPRNPATQKPLRERIRRMLLEIYGNRCAECGCLEGDCHLEVNHIYGRDWKPSEAGSYGRWLRYWREAREGKINLLCPDCNKAYRPKRHVQPPDHCPLFQAYQQSNNPF